MFDNVGSRWEKAFHHLPDSEHVRHPVVSKVELNIAAPCVIVRLKVGTGELPRERPEFGAAMIMGSRITVFYDMLHYNLLDFRSDEMFRG